MQKYLIKDLQQYEGQEITLMGWASNKRESKGLVFIVLRDGTGWCQCVVSLDTIGDDFVYNKDAAVLKVPSSIVPQEFNYLINPNHPEAKRIKIKETYPMVFDRRIYST